MLNPGPELTPDGERLTSGSPIIVAGSLSEVPAVGTVLDPTFVYSLAPDGTATSLLDSGSNPPYLTFKISELKAALASRG